MKRKFSKRHKRLMEVVREAREKAELTQKQLGKKLKRGKNFISYVENGERSLDVCEFIDYAKAIGAAPDKLFARILK